MLFRSILDLVAVLVLLAAFLLFFDPGLEAHDSQVFSAIRYGGLVMLQDGLKLGGITKGELG